MSSRFNQFQPLPDPLDVDLSVRFSFVPDPQENQFYLDHDGSIEPREVLAGLWQPFHYSTEVLAAQEGSLCVSLKSNLNESVLLRLHLAMPFSIETMGNQLTLEDSRLFDRLTDISGCVIQEMLEAKNALGRVSELQILLESTSANQLVPFWCLGSSVGIHYEGPLKAQTAKDLAADFSVWDPYSAMWITSSHVDQMSSVQQLYERDFKQGFLTGQENVLAQIRYRDIMGMIQSAGDELMAAEILATSSIAPDRQRALALAMKSFEEDLSEKACELILKLSQ